MRHQIRPCIHFFILAMVTVSLAACGEEGEVEGGVEPNWDNPIEGLTVNSVQAANDAVTFSVYVPRNLGSPTKIFVSPPEVPEQERQVDFVFQTADYGLVSVGEGPAIPPADEWEDFIKSAVADNDDPTTHGTAEIVTLDNGEDALITTTEDRTRSDICWLDMSGTFEFCVLGPQLTRDDVVKIANMI